MGLSGLSGSLFNYMNGGSSLLSSIYGLNRSSSLFGTSSTSRYGSYNSRLNSYGGLYSNYGLNTGLYSSIGSYYEKMTYNQIKTGAAGVRTHEENLSRTGEGSLFEKAEKTGNTDGLTAEITSFVEDYNTMLTNMKKAGTSIYNIYTKQFGTLTTIYKDALSKIGITAAKDGTLSIDEDVLKEADIDSMKKVFYGTTSFAGRIATKSIYVESNAVSNLSNKNYITYNRSGSYGSSNYYNSYGGYSANSFGSIYQSLFDSYF